MLRLFDRILRISDLEAEVKEEKSGGVAAEESKHRDDVAGLLAREQVVKVM